MRVQTEEWRRFIPGVRMYKGKKTLFYNGEKLYDEDFFEPLIYNREERQTWEVIIVLPGVEVISKLAISECKNIKKVIISDTVRRIEDGAFWGCTNLEYVRLSTNLEHIGECAFSACKSLTSICIPPSCRAIDDRAFVGCEKLIILSLPRHTQLGNNVIKHTALMKAAPFTTDSYEGYEDNDTINDEEVNDWIRNLHADDEFSLHRACSSYNPLDEVIFEIIRRQGLKAFKKPDSVGVTPSQYLSENPYADIKEQKMIKRYILDMMGEVI
ncbi:leucine-rich repeat domain-containing protein [Chaetoceros tenuissimus]|uniref:Leucine-rich repeat domain-containing protein n=1 Tax=Chaetoceros tenuissimus TaxID=426638 RepID=A0AAD3CGY5_9STRA|nr:leucine-rich repeat domain-containing protein [Chaetoceros tenuissimus]